ncbi:hypothetical protein [Methylomonas methanica]|uniref:Uncharacterized protein n=1 Tax=Methylomonas methanica (strain DSM 25384 / MC09) TaxID=857087 RepID=G0A6K0_METMM|nr:hypothetical protein [Methylomonas methanica]AEF99301.1 hypothetical protein Metme_0863 [Methylomonas methanica MC09]
MFGQVCWVLFALVVGMPSSFAEQGLMDHSSEMVSGELKAKRLGPSKVDPVVIGKVRYEVIHWGKERGLKQNGGYIAAFDASSGKELWILKVYDVAYNPNLEGDVQDVFIVSMSKGFFSGKLHIEDEKGRNFIIDPDTRGVEQE